MCEERFSPSYTITPQIFKFRLSVLKQSVLQNFEPEYACKCLPEQPHLIVLIFDKSYYALLAESPPKLSSNKENKQLFLIYCSVTCSVLKPDP